jgi:hypothetical protein
LVAVAIVVAVGVLRPETAAAEEAETGWAHGEPEYADYPEAA